MGAWNFMVDMGQYATLSEHKDLIEKLTKRIEILEDWIRYYEQRGRPQETCRTSGTEGDKTYPQDETGQGIRPRTCIEEPAQVPQDKPV